MVVTRMLCACSIDAPFDILQEDFLHSSLQNMRSATNQFENLVQQSGELPLWVKEELQAIRSRIAKLL